MNKTAEDCMQAMADAATALDVAFCDFKRAVYRGGEPMCDIHEVDAEPEPECVSCMYAYRNPFSITPRPCPTCAIWLGPTTWPSYLRKPGLSLDLPRP